MKKNSMVSPITYDTEKREQHSGRFAASLTAMISFMRGLPLFFSRRPGTPLRVLCLMAFDTVHVLRKSRRISSATLKHLALLLDFSASANDFFDKKGFSRQEYEETRRQLEKTQSGVELNEYMRRLRNLENQRPSTRGDDQHHQSAQAYRESVIRLSLGMVAAMALDKLSIEDGIQATFHDEDLETLYRIVMLCQIIDDVLDFAKDTNSGLPSFLTAHTSPAQALVLTSDAARWYADRSGLPASPFVFPFRVALLGISTLAQLTIMLGQGRLKCYAIRNWFAGITGRRASSDAHS